MSELPSPERKKSKKIKKERRKSSSSLRNQSPEKAFYDAVSDLCDLVDFNDVVFYNDFKRISSAYAYIRSTDMHEGNFGLVSLQNPSPESFVILDFDADSHI